MASLSDPDIRLEAAETLRSLIERVVLVPNPSAPDRLDARYLTGQMLGVDGGVSL